MGRFLLTGLPGAAVRESRDRVRAAITASGFRFPRQSLLVHLAPGDLRKDGPLLDLPIALGILAASSQLPTTRLTRFLAAGELSLDGRVRPVRGLLPIAQAARSRGVEGILVPAEGAAQAALDGDTRVFPVASLQDAAAFLGGHLDIAPAIPAATVTVTREHEPSLDDVRGHDEAKRALTVAAAGGHNVFLIGPPGSGKTLLARRLVGLLPDLDGDASLECTRIRSVTDPTLAERVVRPPFRAPHHTASPAAMIGGGPQLRPGEITLAHHGVLFLDEFPEFPRHVIESLRQPMEDRRVTVSRAIGSVHLPANIQLVAAMNPCPCGYRGHRRVECRCTEGEVKRYQKRISGPILDRFDLFVEIPSIDTGELIGARVATPDPDRPLAIARALKAQERRFRGTPRRRNSELTPAELERQVLLDDDARRLVVAAAERLQLSARAVHRTLRVARTVADLRDADQPGPADIAFALSCRPPATAGLDAGIANDRPATP